MKTADKEWPEWTDVLGQTYKAGDYVAIAIINDRSPQMVIGRVVRINRIDSKRKPIVKTFWRRKETDSRSIPQNASITREDKDIVWYQESSCTVTIEPEIDARNFYRGGNQKEKKRLVTYTIPENIIKVPSPNSKSPLE